MRVLIASSTVEHSERDGDFFTAEHGELLMISPVICQNPECPCHRTFIGLSAPVLHGGDGRSTWGLVAERDVKDIPDLNATAERWKDDDMNGEIADAMHRDVIALSKDLAGYEVGTVVRVNNGSTGSHIYLDGEDA